MNNNTYRRSLVGPVILIGFGVILLLNNLGLLSWTIWDTLFRLWPVILIAIGLDILIGRRSLWGSLLSAALVLAIFGGAIWLFASRPAGGEAVTTEQISQPLGGAARAEVEIGFGVGQLRVSTMTDSKNLIEGTVALNKSETITRDFEITGDTARFTLRSQGVPVIPFGGFGDPDSGWQLKLNRDVPMAVSISIGVGESQIELSELHATSVQVNTGVGQTTLTLPRQGQVKAQVSGGVGQTIIYIPAGMAARIEVRNGLGNVSVSGDYTGEGGVYYSAGYSAAENRVDLEVNGGVGNIVIEER